MRNLERTKGWGNIIQSKPVLVVFGIFLVIFAWNVFGFWNKMEETSKNKKIVEDKVTSLEQQKEKLSGDISNLQTDAGKEKVFRENFGLAKEGEDMIVVVEDKNAPVPVSANSGGFFSFLRNLFK